MKYHYDFYLKFDALLLTCVFQTFRKKSINSSEWHPAHYSFTTGYSSDAMLRFTVVNLRLVSDIEKYQFIESTIRSMICKGYAQANNKFLKSYDDKKPTSNIICLDTNNLSGHSMMQLLLTELHPKDVIEMINLM